MRKSLDGNILVRPPTGPKPRLQAQKGNVQVLFVAEGDTKRIPITDRDVFPRLRKEKSLLLGGKWLYNSKATIVAEIEYDEGSSVITKVHELELWPEDDPYGLLSDAT